MEENNINIHVQNADGSLTTLEARVDGVFKSLRI
jgi:hypothetical protein